MIFCVSLESIQSPNLMDFQASCSDNSFLFKNLSTYGFYPCIVDFFWAPALKPYMLAFLSEPLVTLFLFTSFTMGF